MELAVNFFCSSIFITKSTWWTNYYYLWQCRRTKLFWWGIVIRLQRIVEIIKVNIKTDQLQWVIQELQRWRQTISIKTGGHYEKAFQITKAEINSLKSELVLLENKILHLVVFVKNRQSKNIWKPLYSSVAGNVLSVGCRNNSIQEMGIRLVQFIFHGFEQHVSRQFCNTYINI